MRTIKQLRDYYPWLAWCQIFNNHNHHYYPDFKRGSNRLCSFVRVMNNYAAIKWQSRDCLAQALNYHAILASRRLFWRPDCFQEEVNFHEVLKQRELLKIIYEALRKQVRGSLKSKRSKRMLPFYLLSKFSRLSLGILLS